ncbi:MAG: MATE family efflux transporter [Clostridia bacterium]|nr:MATE family efflux transporter [Clostridia bacterium]
MKKTSTDLTKGGIVKTILLFALPIFVAQVFQNLYNSVDAIIVGRYVSTSALAAVTSCTDISFLLTGFFTGLSTGSGILFARHFGAKDEKKLHDTIHTAVLFAMILGLVMATLGILLTPVLLRVVGCPEDVYPLSSQYLRIYLVGVLFTAMYNVGSGVLRAVGDSKSPFVYLVISSLINIVLNLIFVIVFNMGVTGVAVATIISQGTSVLLVFRRLTRAQDVYRLSLKDLKIDKEILWQVMDLGLPAALQSCMLSISNLFVQRYVNAFGSLAMAGVGAAKKIDKFVGLVGQSLGQATATFVSQNLGAKRSDRAFKGIRACLIMAFISVAAMGIPVYFNAEFFVNLFTGDAAAAAFGIAMVHVMMPCYFVQSVNQVFSNATRGFGKSRMVMLCSLSGMIGIRQIYLAVSTRLSEDIRIVYAGYPIGWFFSALFVCIYFFAVIYPKKKTLEVQA